jgi:iron complex transport system substrate-binding protein
MLTALNAAGLPAYAFSAEQPGELVDGITRMGQLTGHVQQAQKAVDLLNSRMKMVTDAVAAVQTAQRPRVYVAGSGILKTFGGDFFQTLMVRNAGGVSVSQGIRGGKIDVSPEQVLAWNPDVIILTSYTQDTVSGVLTNPKLQNVAAVLNKRVYVMPKYIVSWDMPVPESFLGTLWLARTLYPDRLHIDLATEIAIFYRQFYGFTVPPADVQALSR